MVRKERDGVNRVNIKDATDLDHVEWAKLDYVVAELEALDEHLNWLESVHTLKWRTSDESRPLPDAEIMRFTRKRREAGVRERLLDEVGYLPVPSDSEVLEVTNLRILGSELFAYTLSGRMLRYRTWSRQTGRRLAAVETRSSTSYRRIMRRLYKGFVREHERILKATRRMKPIRSHDPTKNFLRRFAILEQHLNWWRSTKNCREFINTRRATPLKAGTVERHFNLIEFQNPIFKNSEMIWSRISGILKTEIPPPGPGDIAFLECIEKYAQQALKELQFGTPCWFEPRSTREYSDAESRYRPYLRQLGYELEAVVRATCEILNSWDAEDVTEGLDILLKIDMLAELLGSIPDPQLLASEFHSGIRPCDIEGRDDTLRRNLKNREGWSQPPSVDELSDIHAFDSYVESFVELLEQGYFLDYRAYKYGDIPPADRLVSTDGVKALLVRHPVLALEPARLNRSNDGRQVPSPLPNGAIRDWIRRLYSALEELPLGVDQLIKVEPDLPMGACRDYFVGDLWAPMDLDVFDPVLRSYSEWDIENDPDWPKLSDWDF